MKFINRILSKILFRKGIIEFCYVTLRVEFLKKMKKELKCFSSEKNFNIEIELKMKNKILIWIYSDDYKNIVAAFKYDIKSKEFIKFI